MASITVTYACGHTQSIGANSDTPPICECGERRVSRVSAPAPRFRGICQGPSASMVALEAVPVNAAPAGALLKES